MILGVSLAISFSIGMAATDKTTASAEVWKYTETDQTIKVQSQYYNDKTNRYVYVFRSNHISELKIRLLVTHKYYKEPFTIDLGRSFKDVISGKKTYQTLGSSDFIS